MARNGQDLEDFGGILDPAGWPFNEGPGPLVFHPLPVPARCCGTILQATYADQNDYRCPQCRALVCYTCGCTEASACDLKIVTEATGHVTHLVCAWSPMPGLCSFCWWRAAFEFCQEATGREATSEFYSTIGKSVRAVKGLAWGLGGR
jgi:hypothetical protein